MSSPTPPTAILTIGAGILGLTTSLTLQSAYPNVPITIIANEFPESYIPPGQETPSNPSVNYASAWAGAHYRPIPIPRADSPLKAQLSREAVFAKKAFEVFKNEVAKNEDNGVIAVDGVEILESVTENGAGRSAYSELKTGDGAYGGQGDEFEVLKADGKAVMKSSTSATLDSITCSSVEDPAATWVCRYKTICINPPIYCTTLLDRFTRNGGRVIGLDKPLASISHAFNFLPPERAPGQENVVIVNATGLGFNDPSSFIIRGQTVLVRNNCGPRTLTRQNADGTWTFLIPRSTGETIVGGTKEPRDTGDKPRPETRALLLKRAEKAFPWMVDRRKGEEWDVVRDIVGRRPARDGGMRIETESSGNGKTIVHAYGAGGRGFEISWGVAKEVLGLLGGDKQLQAKL